MLEVAAAVEVVAVGVAEERDEIREVEARAEEEGEVVVVVGAANKRVLLALVNKEVVEGAKVVVEERVKAVVVEIVKEVAEDVARTVVVKTTRTVRTRAPIQHLQQQHLQKNKSNV